MPSSGFSSVSARMPAACLIGLLLLAAPLAPRSALAQESPGAASRPGSLPISWICPMHPEILEAEKGTCPVCRMDLAPVRLDSIWSCAVHSVVSESKPGQCPICRRDLVQVTVALSWTCPDHPEIDQLDPGKCPDGAPMLPRHAPRPHGNHNPLHGGLFFMAPDNWHHLEGAYPERGVFRLHLYDDYTRPLPVEKVRQAKGRIVTEETFDSATRTTREIAAYPLLPAADGRSLEARIEALELPAQMTATLKLAPEGPEYRFDFAFQTFSNEEAVDPSAAAAGVDPSQIALEIPENAEAVLTQLRACHRQIREIIERGAFADVWVPALQGKDLALALDIYARDLPAERRKLVAAAVKRLVLSAWRLDAYGDLGNRQQIGETYARFAAAVAELDSVFPGPP